MTVCSVRSLRVVVRGGPGGGGVDDSAGGELDDLVDQVEAFGAVGDQEHRAVAGGGEDVVASAPRRSAGRGARSARRARAPARRRAARARARAAGAGRPRAAAPPRRRACRAVREARDPVPEPRAARAPRSSSRVASRRAGRAAGSRGCSSRTGARPGRRGRSRARTSSCRYSRRSRPPSVTRPCSGSRKRSSRFATVVLPAPLGPTSATRRPGSSRRSTPSQGRPLARP